MISATKRFAFTPSPSQRKQIERLFVQLWARYHDEGTANYRMLADECDAAGIPMWVQNNVSAMADCRVIKFKNGIECIIDGACQLDWRPVVAR